MVFDIDTNVFDSGKQTVPLITAHMIPGTDFKFMIEF